MCSSNIKAYIVNLFIYAGGIELEKKKAEAIKDELESTMNDLLDISNDQAGGEAEPEEE